MYNISMITISVIVFATLLVDVTLYTLLLRQNQIKKIYIASCVIIFILTVAIIALNIIDLIVKTPMNNTVVIVLFSVVLVAFAAIIVFSAITYAKLNQSYKQERKTTL